jgi:hypothetical protein
MKTLLLTPLVIVMVLNIGSCPVTRPSSDANDVHESMDAVLESPNTQLTPRRDSLSSGQSLTMGEMRDLVREIIRPRCGTCHTSTLATAKPGALAIFDLARDDWSAMITKEHFPGFERRLKSLEEPDRAMVSRLVQAELSGRLQ